MSILVKKMLRFCFLQLRENSVNEISSDWNLNFYSLPTQYLASSTFQNKQESDEMFFTKSDQMELFFWFPTL